MSGSDLLQLLQHRSTIAVLALVFGMIAILAVLFYSFAVLRGYQKERMAMIERSIHPDYPEDMPKDE